MGRSRHLAQHVPMRTAWPTLNVMEPMSGDFGVLQSPTAVNIAKHDATFFDLYKRAIMEGEFSTIEWTQWANLCHIPITPWIENSAPVRAQTLLSLELMSNICEDYIPHIGLFMDELLWNGQNRLDLWMLGGAIASTLPLLKHSHCPLYKISEQQPKLRESLHKSLTAHHRTPTMLWQREGDTAIPMLPIGKQYIPDKVDNLDSIHSQFFIAKIIYMTGDTSHWNANFILPVSRESVFELQSFLQTRLLIAWFRYRRHNNKICFEDILRERSDLIYRSIFDIN